MNQTIMDQVRTAAADLFMVPLEEIRPESSNQTISAWDSMQHLNLIVELEMMFGVKFKPADIQGITSIASAVSAVESKL
jgi:acyl carrier protein